MKLPSSVQVKNSAKAYSKAFNVPISVARGYLCRAFGERDWGALLSKCSTTRQNVSEAEIAVMKQIWETKLLSVFNVPETEGLLNTIRAGSPYNNKPKAIDFVVYSSEPILDELTTKQAGDLLLKAARDEGCLNEEFVKKVDAMPRSELENVIQISMPVDRHKCFAFLAHALEWELEACPDEDWQGYGYGGTITEAGGTKRPLYLFSFHTYPGDKNQAHGRLIAELGQHSKENGQSPVVLFDRVVSNDEHAHRYSIIGCHYCEGEWYWLFLSQILPNGQLMLSRDIRLQTQRVSSYPIQLATECFENKSMTPLDLAYHCFMNPTKEFHRDGEDTMVEITMRDRVVGLNGWYTYV